MSRQSRRLPELAQHLFARNVGQMQIEQDRVRLVQARQLERETALHRRNQLDVAARARMRCTSVRFEQIVLDVENLALAAARAGRRSRPASVSRLERRGARAGSSALGSSTQNVLPAPTRRLDADRAAHRFGEPLRQRESEARALDARLLGAEAIERREQPRHLVGGNSGPGVRDHDAQHAALGVVARHDARVPPSRLYLTAFATRLSSTCLSRWRSACT